MLYKSKEARWRSVHGALNLAERMGRSRHSRRGLSLPKPGATKALAAFRSHEFPLDTECRGKVFPALAPGKFRVMPWFGSVPRFSEARLNHKPAKSSLGDLQGHDRIDEGRRSFRWLGTLITTDTPRASSQQGGDTAYPDTTCWSFQRPLRL